MRFILVIFLLFQTFSSLAQWNTKNLLQQGRSAIYFDDYVSAIDKFNDIIKARPMLAEPYFFRALAKLNLDDYMGAINDFNKSININPNYAHAYIYRGVSRHKIKKDSLAIEDYLKALKLMPSESMIYVNMGISKSYLKKYKDAEKNYSRALILDPKMTEAFLNRAIVRELLNDFDGAMVDCNSVIQMNGFSDDAYGLRAFLKYKNKDYRGALDDYNKLLKINNKSIKGYMGRALAKHELKDLKGTLSDYNKVVEVDSNYAYAYYNRSLLHSEIGDDMSAIKDLDILLKMNPNNILIYLNRGNIKQNIGDFEGALYDYSMAISVYSDFARAYIARSSLKRMMNDVEGAKLDYRKAIVIFDKYKKMKSGESNAFIDTTANFNKLIDLNSRKDIVKNIVKGRVQDKNIIIQLENYFKVSYLSMDSIRAGKVQYYDNYTMTLNQKYNYEPAVTITNKIGNSAFEKDNVAILNNSIGKGGESDMYFNKSILSLIENKYSESISYLDSCLVLNENNILAYLNRGVVKALEIDYVFSIGEKGNKVLEVKAYRNIEKRKEIPDYNSCIQDFSECIRINNGFVFAWFNRANCEAKSLFIDKAIKDYSEVVRLEPSFAQAYYNRGLLYIYKDKLIEAAADLSKAGELGLLNAYSVINRYCNTITN